MPTQIKKPRIALTAAAFVTIIIVTLYSASQHDATYIMTKKDRDDFEIDFHRDVLKERYPGHYFIWLVTRFMKIEEGEYSIDKQRILKDYLTQVINSFQQSWNRTHVTLSDPNGVEKALTLKSNCTQSVEGCHSLTTMIEFKEALATNIAKDDSFKERLVYQVPLAMAVTVLLIWIVPELWSRVLKNKQTRADLKTTTGPLKAAQPGLEPERELLPRRGRNVVDLDAPLSEKETIDSILSKHSEKADMDHGIIFHPFLDNLKGYAESVADTPGNLPEWFRFEKYGDGPFAYLILNNGIYNALKGSIVEAIQRDNGTDGNSTQDPSTNTNTKKALTAIVLGHSKKGHYLDKTHLLNWGRILGVITDLVNSYTAPPSLEGEIKASKTHKIMELIKSLIKNNNDTRDLMGFLQITADAQSLLRTNEPGAGGDAASDEAGAHPEPELESATATALEPAADGKPLGLFGSPGLKPAEGDRRGPPPAYSPRPEAAAEAAARKKRPPPPAYTPYNS